jgi:hypothetical protein
MKLVCRKCGLAFPMKSIDSFQDIDDLQKMTCGAGGTHRMVAKR